MSSVTEDLLHHFQLLGVVEALAAIFKVCFFVFSCSQPQVKMFLSIICVKILDYFKIYE